MTERPIIFSGPTVRALLADRKTQTRRLATSPLRRAEVGDKLWVRENFHPWKGSASGKTIVYAADDRWIDWGSGENFVDKLQWLTPVRPSIHMPRWASRLSLKVEAVRVEKLHEISEQDCVVEGIEPLGGTGPNFYSVEMPDGWHFSQPSARACYEELWRTLHGARSWAENPDVLVLAFTVER